MYKLTTIDKDILIKWGYPEAELQQIEYAANEGEITVFNKRAGWWRPITPETAIRILGRREFLSGLSRAAFHRTAERQNNKRRVSFDTSVWW